MAAFIPMFLVMLYLLVSLSGATKAYADITQSVTYANQYAMDFNCLLYTSPSPRD